MKKIIYQSKAIQWVIVIAALCFLVTVFPLRLWKETVTASIPMQTGEVTGPIDDSRMLVQAFAAQYDHMGSVQIFLGEETVGEYFYFRMLDAGNREMFEEKVRIDPLNLPGFYEILVDQELKVGDMYFFILQGTTPGGRADVGLVSQLYVGSEWISMTDQPYAGVMYYQEESMGGRNLVADYRYTVPLRKGKMALLLGVTLLAAAGLLASVGHYYRKRPEKDRLITVERVFRTLCNPLTTLGVLTGLGAVILGKFGNFTLDNSFFFVSILLLGGILFYGINHNRDGQAAIINKAICKEKWQDFLQSVFIAGAIAGCCEYMNGLYDIHHTIASRKEVIFFCLAVIVMLGRKAIFRIYNLIYLVVSGICGYLYYEGQLTGELKELDAEALKLTVWAGIFAGFVILNVVIQVLEKIYRREMKRPALLYGGLLLAFFGLMILFRNGRWWTVALAVSFTLFYLQYGAWKGRDILTNILRGIVLHFIWATGYALLHRPFVTYRTARYTHIFHTVTITATYLTMVECAALVLFLAKFKKSRRLRDVWKESVFLGVVTSYLLFTMARTGFLAAAVAAVLALLLMAGGKGKKRIQNRLAAAGMMILSVVVCFPVTFFVQRTVPALVSEPVLYEIESYPDDIMRGRKVSSVEFMRVGRFIDVFAEKIFGIPEGTFDIYGEIREFENTHVYAGEEFLKVKDAQALGVMEAHTTVAEDKQLQEEAGADITYFEEQKETEPDYTNGRTDIFRSYLEQLTMKGHEEMGALLQDGSLATHAHNIYLQFAYDHGIPMGILFIVVGLVTLVNSGIYYRRNKETEPYGALPMVVITTVAAAGLVEWIFHFSNPSGFIFLLVLTPLLFQKPPLPEKKAQIFQNRPQEETIDEKRKNTF